MSYIKLTNGIPVPYSLAQLCHDNPNVSFPHTPPADTLASYGVFPCAPAGDPPAHDPNIERLAKGYEQVDGAWREIWTVTSLTAEEKAANLAAWRDTATLTRRQFCLACLQAGLLTPDDAVTAASGGWPASFNAALAGMSAMEVAAAKVEWAAVGTIRRNAPLLAVVQATAGVTDAQLDALFGWVG